MMKLEQEYTIKKITAPHPIEVEVPGSKSITNRALLLASLAEGTSRLEGILFSDDSRHFLRALQDLGFEVDIDEENRRAVIVGMGGKIPKQSAAVDVGSAGTAARFLTAFLALSEGEYQLNASEQMKKRPMRELIEALEQLGTHFSFREEPYHFPFTVRGRQAGEQGAASVSAKGGQGTASACYDGKIETTIDVEKSSQFLSALLIASVLFDRDFTVHVRGSHGMAYVDMTIQMMEQFGLLVEKIPDGYYIPAAASYRAQNYRIEPDVSAACYFYAAGAVLGVPAKVRNVHFKSLQGDVRFLEVLGEMGCTLNDGADGIRLVPWNGGGTQAGKMMCRLHIPDDRKEGWSLASFSDQALTLAAIAPFADAPVVVGRIAHIRYQECDRMNAILTNLRAMGVSCEETDGGIRIDPVQSCLQGGENPHGARIATYEDHRVAMAFSIPGLVVGNQVIENPACCRKTFEDFFEVLEAGVY